MTLAIAFVLFAGFVVVFLVDQRRKHRWPFASASQRIDLDPPADPTPAPDPEPEPAPWPPTR